MSNTCRHKTHTHPSRHIKRISFVQMTNRLEFCRKCNRYYTFLCSGTWDDEKHKSSRSTIYIFHGIEKNQVYVWRKTYISCETKVSIFTAKYRQYISNSHTSTLAQKSRRTIVSKCFWTTPTTFDEPTKKQRSRPRETESPYRNCHCVRSMLCYKAVTSTNLHAN